jgi:hypothetical protein
MKKIAILITGRIQFDSEQYNNFRDKIVQNYHVDLFVSYCKNIDPSVVKHFRNTFAPKKMIESDEVYMETEKYKEHKYSNAHRMKCMFLNRKKAFELLKEYLQENGIQYDYVISSRCDLYFTTCFNLDKISIQPNDNRTIYVPAPEYDYLGGLNDQFAVGSLESVEIYCSLYDHLIQMLEDGVCFHPETLLRVHLERNKIQVKRFELNYWIRRFTTL